MLRIFLPTLFVFALAAGPATLPAQNPGIEATGTAASCELMSCGERGAAIDPNGVAVASCELVSCGERGAASDPNGVVVASCELPICGERGASIDPNGVAVASCELPICAERGASSDPNGVAVASLIGAPPVPHRAFLLA